MTKTILITGASRGIGSEVLTECAKRGYDVIGVCKNDKDGLKKTIEAAKMSGVMAIGISGVDVGNYDECMEKIYRPLKEKNIEADCIINNAGISHIGLLQDMDIEEWNKVISTNLTSVFNMSKLFIPDMVRKKRGTIINVSSVWGNTGASCEVAYSASKGGINSFTKALAKELAPSGITVNAVAFGTIDTKMNSFLSEEEKMALIEEIPMGRMGSTKEAAKILADIIEAPKYMTGQIITMDGGWI